MLTALVPNRAGCLACRLAGCLAFTAAAIFHRLFQIFCCQGFNSLHNICPFLEFNPSFYSISIYYHNIINLLFQLGIRRRLGQSLNTLQISGQRYHPIVCQRYHSLRKIKSLPSFAKSLCRPSQTHCLPCRFSDFCSIAARRSLCTTLVTDTCRQHQRCRL